MAKPEEALSKWTDCSAGFIKKQLVQAFDRPLRRSSQSITAIDPGSVHGVLYEVVWLAVRNRIAPRELVTTVLKDTKLPSREDLGELLLDVTWLIGNEIEASKKESERHSSPEWQNLCKLTRLFADENIVPLRTIKASIELDLLHGAGLAADPQTMTKKTIRINTKNLYTQNKYNLLREESEGFSKVLCLLHTGVSKEQLESTKKDLLALIGFFDLDPNRVLDLVLDAYEMQPRNDFFVDLLRSFKRESLPHVVGFKFQFYKREESDVAKLSTPHSLYRLAATLIKKEMLTAEELLPHLSPNRETIVKETLARMEKLELEAKSFGKVNLAAKAASKDDDDAKKKEPKEEEDSHSQIYGLIVGLLEVGANDLAFEMIEWFQQQGINPLMYKPMMHQICVLVHVLIERFHEPISFKKMSLVLPSDSESGKNALVRNCGAKPLESESELLSVVFPILELLGSQLHHDPSLFNKVVRVVLRYLESHSDEDNLTRIDDVINQCFLPSLACQECDPSVAFQLWELIKKYPFTQRYRMYQKWEESYKKSADMSVTQAKCVQDTRKVMRRLTADRAKQSGRSLTHIAHSNPLIVFRTMLRQIQSYDNLIQPVVESFKFVTPLGMDVLSYVLISELSKSRKSMKSDGTNISLWLASLANFSGSFYRKYPNVELGGLLQYLIHRLEQWESVDLVVLSELLSKMGSCVSFEDISLSQLEAQAGGPHLWHEPADPKLMNRRAIPRLRDALFKKNLALPLCVLICQVRSKIEFDEEASPVHLKLLGRLYDTCQMTLNQLLQFLNGVCDPGVYTNMLPTVSQLVAEYRLPPELALTLCRPAIRFDDPMLRKAPRSIHASSSNSSSVEPDGKWAMNSPALLNDVKEALQKTEDHATPLVGMTEDMYVTFWSLVLYDIYIPFGQYESEITRLRNSMTVGQAAASSGGGQLRPSDRKKMRERVSVMIDKLTNEQKDQVNHRKKIFERLDEKKSVFFVKESTNQSAINELLQKCIIPRALISPEDAMFCAKFMERIHYISTPCFSTLQYYHKVNLKLATLVLCVTEREAGNFGVFMKETLTLLHRWYQSVSDFEEQALNGKVGFSVDLNDPNKLLPHRQYKSMYAKWHKWMERVYATTLQSGEYMQIRNTLIVLTKTIDVFPNSRSTAEHLLSIVEGLTKEDREDIKIMAKRYFALLTKRKSTLAEDKLLTSVQKRSQKKRNEQAKQNQKRSASTSQTQEVESGEIVPPSENAGRGVDNTSAHRKERDEARESSEAKIPANRDQNDAGSSRKRQRSAVESTEAALRRQLTEKKEQERKNAREDKSSGNAGGGGSSTSGGPASGTGRKIVSLVSRKRERERERDRDQDRKRDRDHDLAQDQEEGAVGATPDQDQDRHESKRENSGESGSVSKRQRREQPPKSGASGGGGSQERKKMSKANGDSVRSHSRDRPADSFSHRRGNSLNRGRNSHHHNSNSGNNNSSNSSNNNNDSTQRGSSPGSRRRDMDRRRR